MFEDILEKKKEIYFEKCNGKTAHGHCGYPMTIDKNINRQHITCPSCGCEHLFVKIRGQKDIVNHGIERYEGLK